MTLLVFVSGVPSGRDSFPTRIPSQALFGDGDDEEERRGRLSSKRSRMRRPRRLRRGGRGGGEKRKEEEAIGKRYFTARDRG